ncbi:RNA-guided endonuclease InsQ/TnpB family protein [Anabaena azotica]|uniref:IS200/IS605 family element transposase accessory protein TnpB n=1 Tax=Anabaena azotica FACHB-119 TaxID=947527 RepID=A0ABR8CYZ0_9NOST|nr:RNA-guided endonuclease TnpB family protein [Anabaena azotica]MBD2499190.1 IS200/IS605 family element transposase accessory protein TnpB [Anabaena azotica FACHB-119]
MLLAFKTELKLNNKQRTQLLKHCGVARHAWNWGLALTKQILGHNKANPGEKIKFPSAIDLHKWLVALVKPENPWYFEVSKCAPQYALRNLRTAWDRCFKKVSGVPKFKKKGKSDSFELDGTIKICGTRKIQLPRLGLLKTYESLPQVQPKSVTISRVADRWYISFRIEVEPTNTTKMVDVVGVDLGVKSLATLSTGEVFEGAKSYRKLEAKLSRVQWLNRHKQIGSANWKKAQIKIARLHQLIANIRKDTLHKLTTYLAKNHGVIVIEDLNVSGMLANRKLAASIADMGFYEFRRQLEYKTELYGSELVIVNRFYPSSKTCSNCGTKKKSLSLQERVFKCEHCSFECNRDLNAAINLSMAVSSTVLACGSGEADFSEMKQENFGLERKR